MSVLFDDARLSARSPGRSTSGLWLSVGVHVIVGALIVVTIGAPGKPPTPRRQPLKVFLSPVMLPAVPVVAPRLAPPPPPPPVRELARAEVPKPVPVAPIVAKPVEPPPQPLVPAVTAAVERLRGRVFNRASSNRTDMCRPELKCRSAQLRRQWRSGSS